MGTVPHLHNEFFTMAIVRILQYPDPRLKKPAEPVEQVDDTVRAMVNNMFETHYAQDNCAALAATQLDFANPKRITVIDFSPGKNQPLCLINPDIFHREGTQYEYEGCMSMGDSPNDRLYEKVKRAEKINVRALDREGQPFEMEAEGFMAKCIQHEVDHLDGILFIDRLSMLKRNRLIRQLNRKKP